MCGIFGVVSLNGLADIDQVNDGIGRISHRGPDGSGTWLSGDGRVALGHRRLSIIDLSMASHQPMATDDGRYTIVFNGEIYNYRALRDELMALGFPFVSTGDTEVVLAAYRVWGAGCLEKMNGMFALAIHDRGDATHPPQLFFARDRAGEKPFYYIKDERRFQFASELKSLRHGGRVSLNGLNHYLALGYVPGGLCLFEGVHKLPPGHCGRLDLNSGTLQIWRYWALPENRPDARVDGPQLAAEAGSLLEDSVRLRLVADVPVGVLLSGGLDSSLVVAAAARVSSSPVDTFTIALPGSSLDEALHAQLVASHFGTRHHVLPLADASLNQLDGLAPFVDEPIADSSILPAWLVFGLARQQVTVALGGDGGDELFGGYGDYTNSLSDAARWGWVPRGVQATLARAAACLPAGVYGRNRLASQLGGPYQQLIWGRPYFDGQLRRRLFKGDALASLGGALMAPEHFLLSLFKQGCDPLDSMTRTHFGSILPDDFLVKVDRASMARSLEVRAPLLDHRLIEFAFGRVPSHWKVLKGQPRRLQRLLARTWLPDTLDVNRKQGFSIPVNEWLRAEGETKLMARLEGLPDVLEQADVRRLVRGHLAGRANGGRLFALIMLAIAMKNAQA